MLKAKQRDQKRLSTPTTARAIGLYFQTVCRLLTDTVCTSPQVSITSPQISLKDDDLETDKHMK